MSERQNRHGGIRLVDVERLDAAVFAQFDQQRQIRDRAIPQLTTLVGDAATALDYWNRWCSKRRFGIATQADRPASAWLEAALERLDLPRYALERVAGAYSETRSNGPASSGTVEPISQSLSTRTGPEAARQQLRGMPEYELATLSRQFVRGDLPAEIERLFMWLLRQIAGGSENCTHDPQALANAIGLDAERDAETVLIAVARFAGTEQLPPLLWLVDNLFAARLDSAALSRGMRSLCKLAGELPQSPLAVVMSRECYTRWSEATPESNVKAMVRAGRIDLPRFDRDALSEWIRSRYARADAERLLPVLLSVAARGYALGTIASAIASLDAFAEHTESAQDAARSMAERFLFDVLQATPATTGLFELNGRVEVAGGWWEIDLLARSLRFAIELDGYYHFQGPDDYRRDRRKDFELQRAGYLVRRWLSEDVVTELESILADIFVVLNSTVERPQT